MTLQINSINTSKSRAIAWDPTVPFSLSFCPVPDDAPNTDKAEVEQSQDKATHPLSILLSHDGTGIHPAETTCLLSLLDANDAHHENKQKGKGGGGDLHELSLEYRRCLCECLMSLKSDNDSNVHNSDNIAGELNMNDNYESLALIYAMMHLTEIYTLPTKTSPRSGFIDKLQGTGGSLTADTIRYLRTHHCIYDLQSSAIQDLLNMDQPEYFVPSNDSVAIYDDPLLLGPFREPYYNLVLHLMNFGQLNNVWGVLSRHSSCRRSEEEALRGEFSKEGEGWGVLRALLLSAPLPGGRGEGDDSGLVEDDDDYNDDDEVDVDANTRLMQEVSRSSYCLWEACPKLVNQQRIQRLHDKCLKIGIDPPVEDVEVLPEQYAEGIALSAFYMWQRTVKSHLNDNSCAALFTRFPQLEQICNVLLGQGTIGGGDWPELLASELIYARPGINPADIAIRARFHMQNCGVLEGSQEAMILQVMAGDATRVLSSMFSFGGGSGAALPATVTSLLADMLVDSKVITQPTIQTELHLAAAEAILSSFATQGQSDIGVRTTVRFLLPHAPPKRIGGEVCYEPRIAATIYETLSHRFPDSDAEAHSLLNLCQEMISRGSARIADACESLTFCRATYHASKGDLAKQMYWLLRGIEVMAVWLPEDFRRTLGFASRRNFDTICEVAADELLTCLAAVSCFNGKDHEELTKLTDATAIALSRASIILEAVIEDEPMVTPLKDSVEVALLYHIVKIANKQAENDYQQVATHIVSCLGEQSSGGSVTTLANATMYYKLLQIATAILGEEETFHGDSMASRSSVFSVSGLQILMSRMNQVLFWEEKSSEKMEYLGIMRMMLCKGLMRAFASGSKHEEEKKSANDVTLDDEVAMMLGASV